MFITLHVKTIDSHVANIDIIKRDSFYSVGSFKKRIQKCINEGELAAVRAIFERTNKNNEVEYHIFDFTGKSFIIIKSNDKKTLKGLELTNWITDLEERLKMSGTNGPRVYTVKKLRTYTTFPDKDELSYHNLIVDKMEEELVGYFRYFRRVY